MKTSILKTKIGKCLFFIVFFISFQSNAQYSGGSGTLADPYQISNLTDLALISSNIADWDNHFIQMNDIDASGTLTLNGSTGFMPIGSNPFNSGVAFTGTYNGMNYSISNLFINRPNTDYQGLFGFLGANSKLENIILINDSIIGYNNVGGLVASSINSTILNCNVQGSIKGFTSVAGLISLSGTGTIISNCHVDVKIVCNAASGGMFGTSSGSNYSNCTSKVILTKTGGLANQNGGFGGRFESGKIDQCFSKGDVNSPNTNAVGGFIGFVFKSKISDCYSITDVNGGTSVGGFCGVTGLVSTPVINDTIINCYSVGNVTSTGFKGGFIGQSVTTIFSSNYWNSDAIDDINILGFGQYDDSTEVHKRNTLQLRNEFNYGQWDFSNIWKMGECSNSGYPVFTWQNINQGNLPYNGVNYANGILTAIDDSTNYQWINCTNNSLMFGDTNQIFSPNNNGIYALVVFNSPECIDTSDCISVTDAELTIDNIQFIELKVYPNPTSGKIQIIGLPDCFVTLKIYDMNGKLLRTLDEMNSNSVVDLSSINEQMVLIELRNEEFNSWHKIYLH